MKTWWKINTKGDPLTAIRHFLRDLWLYAEFDGMILPVYQANGTDLAPQLITNPDQIASAEPCAPFVAFNTAQIAAQLARENPQAHYAVTLRACEARSLTERQRLNTLPMQGWTKIGIDCLASFPIQDFDWRLKKAGSLDALTREVLRFSRQGGIAPYRFRQVCQMCLEPFTEAVDLSINLIGIPAKKVILIATQGELEGLLSSQFGDGRAQPSLIAQHYHALERIHKHREQYIAKKIRSLASDFPSTAQSLITVLAGCLPCHACLDACPLCFSEYINPEDIRTASYEFVCHWLGTCAQCGMCEQACPEGLPLALIHYHIRQNLKVPAAL